MCVLYVCVCACVLFLYVNHGCTMDTTCGVYKICHLGMKMGYSHVQCIASKWLLLVAICTDQPLKPSKSLRLSRLSRLSHWQIAIFGHGYGGFHGFPKVGHRGTPNPVVMDDHDLALKPMLTWGVPAFQETSIYVNWGTTSCNHIAVHILTLKSGRKHTLLMKGLINFWGYLAKSWMSHLTELSNLG